MSYNWDCYWSFEDYDIIEGKKIPKTVCDFYNLSGFDTCDHSAPCKHYCHVDKVDEYIKYLLEEIDRLTEQVESMVKLP